MGIPSRMFMHPKDKAASDALKRLPMLDELTRQFLHHFEERAYLTLLLATGLEITSRQKPALHQWLVDVATPLGIPIPRMFLVDSSDPNAYAVGAKAPFIIVHSSLLTSLNEDEARAVIAHECGHIACDHMLYQTLSYILVHYGRTFLGDTGKLLTGPILMGLRYWTRMSEFSADRAAAAAMGDVDPMKRALLRLAAGPKELTEDVDMDEYMKQGRSFELAMDSLWVKYLLSSRLVWASHPMAAVRISELHSWQSSEDFLSIRDGRFSSSSDVRELFGS